MVKQVKTAVALAALIAGFLIRQLLAEGYAAAADHTFTPMQP